MSSCRVGGGPLRPFPKPYPTPPELALAPPVPATSAFAPAPAPTPDPGPDPGPDPAPALRTTTPLAPPNAFAGPAPAATASACAPASRNRRLGRGGDVWVEGNRLRKRRRNFAMAAVAGGVALAPPLTAALVEVVALGEVLVVDASEAVRVPSFVTGAL